MLILGIESSCDETALSVSRNGREDFVQLCAQPDRYAYHLWRCGAGNRIPEAHRSHCGFADQALKEAGITRQELDAIAVTYAPGLIGALLVGVNFAKAAALALNIPIIPVHHIRGHIAANYIAFPELEPPFVCLSVSGGNTLILDVRDYTDTRIMGSTRDDAAGECFDKIARVLGMPYPGRQGAGRESMTGKPHAIICPVPR